ncbi:MAG: MFS transporter [Alphaproteobacteria bacterium]
MFYGWVILAACSSIYFLAVGTVTYGFSIIIPDIITATGWSRSQASLGFTLLVLAFGLLAPVAAMAIGRIGARRTMGIGSLIATAFAISCFYMNSLLQYYFMVLGLALGIAMLGGVACPHTLTNWFSRKRTLALGVYLCSGGMGAFFAAPSISLLVRSTGNWRYAWLAMAFATIVGGVIAIIFVRDSPKDKGTFIDGIDPALAAANPAVVASKGVYQTDISWEVKDAVRSAPFWLTVIAASAVVYGILAVTSQAMLHLPAKGISAITAASAIGIIGLFGTGGRLLTGFLGDRIDPKHILCFGLSLEALAVLMLIYVDSVFMTYAIAVVMGAGSGMALVANPALVASYFGNRNYAGLIAVNTVVVVVLGSLGPYITSRIFDMVGSYTPAFLGFSILSLLSVLSMIWMRPPGFKDSPAGALQPAQ